MIVASNGGSTRHPAWYHNLRAQPTARARLWPLLTQYNPSYARYAERSEREIPVVVLRRR